MIVNPRNLIQELFLGRSTSKIFALEIFPLYGMRFYYWLFLLYTAPSPVDKLPPNFLHVVEAAGDRLIAKAAQLVQN